MPSVANKAIMLCVAMLKNTVAYLSGVKVPLTILDLVGLPGSLAY
jgi:hypothetical protein